MSITEELKENKYNRGFLISYNYKVSIGGHIESNFGSFLSSTLDVYPSELNIKDTLKTEISQEFNLNPNTIDVTIMSITSMNINDFKNFVDGQ